jgi:lysophospholipase L1-like esterase
MLKMLTVGVFCGVLAAGCATTTSLKKNDCIVFLGDSITQQGGGKDGYVTLVKEAIEKAYPNDNIKVINAGISGHKVPNCQGRLYRDVLSKNPTVVVIYIGINDVWHGKNGTPKNKFDAGLRDMIEKIKAAKARVILCTPSVIGEKRFGENNLDKLLDEYSDISRKVAKDTGVQLLDLRLKFQDYLVQNNCLNKPKGILTRDTVHLNKKGNEFVAKAMLEALNVPETAPAK